MRATISERLVRAVTRNAPSTSRRGFLGSAALVGAALAVNPWGYLVRPASAYDTICGGDAACGDGYSVFCCSINGGKNSCPPNSFIGGWWKADSSSFCGGSARYYVDCNAYKGDPTWQCHCGSGSCDQRRVACNQFRYGQCSLEITAAQSGPVVCRLVSCAPPWQRFAGVCTATSATDNRTGTHTAPCLTGPDPRGSLDGATAVGPAVRLTGWAYDPDLPDTDLQVAVYRDGVGVAWFPTGVPRPDVNAAYGIGGNHGFDITVPTEPGTHTFTVFAINVSAGGNPAIGGATVSIVDRHPVGVLDSAVPAADGTIRLQGWAVDFDQSATAISVAVYRDGQGVAWFPTGVPRGDVNSAFGIGGDHGFDIRIPSAPGDHSVVVFGINIGGEGGNAVLGTAVVRAVGLPRGVLDDAGTVPGNRIRVRGWAYDPDQPDTEIQVAVVQGDAVLVRHDTGVPRPDVNSAFGISGRHGFDVTFDAPGSGAGLRVLAVNVGASSADQVIGDVRVTP